MEAGLEHLAWAGGTLRHVDVLLLVAEPTAKSLATVTRAHALAAELGIADVGLVGNRVKPGTRATVERFVADRGLELLALLPEDPAVRLAERVGVSPLARDPDAPAVRALARLAGELASR